MLEGLGDVAWADLEHAYGTAEDVPGLLRDLLSPDPKVRDGARDALFGNVYHQGTRYPATPRVVPFLIEMVAEPSVPDRSWLLKYWGSLITGFFSVRERPTWGDGERCFLGGEEVQPEPEPEPEPEPDEDDSYAEVLHETYRASLAGFPLLLGLLDDPDHAVRAGAAWVLACLPTRAAESVPRLAGGDEPSGWARAAIAFALGELGGVGPLRRTLAEDDFPAARCMAACQLARIDPDPALIGPLLGFLAEPIEGYENVPGAGGPSPGDAALAISLLPSEVQEHAIPALSDRLDRAMLFETVPLVEALLSAAFRERADPVIELTDLQRRVLTRLVDAAQPWRMGNLIGAFIARGLPWNRPECAALIGARVAADEAPAALLEERGLGGCTHGFGQSVG